MKISDFDYSLPSEFIAQTPVEPRDHSRLMVLDRARNSWEHCLFYQIGDYLHPGDVLIFNDSRVMPARLLGNTESGSRVEIFLLRRLGDGVWETLVRPGKRLGVGVKVRVVKPSTPELTVVGEVIDRANTGTRIVRFSNEELLPRLGEVPLPPYIKAPLTDPERYQTIYAKVEGSVAAPTAGLHFTSRLLRELEAKGIQFAFVTLHIGLDTFRPIREDDFSQHSIHREYGVLNQETAHLLNQAKRDGRRIIAVGTSTVRLVEAGARRLKGELQPFSDWISLFIFPGYNFCFIDAMVTNFHLPRSTLLLLVSAFAGRDLILQAYEEAKRQNYRFYSFGDCMLIL